MINVDVESKVLLDKLYNLRSKDSIILTRMQDEKDIAEQTKNRTADEKLELAAKVKELSDEEILLAKEGELLKEALKNINKTSFGVVFNKLNIDFDPKMLVEKVEAVLPSTIDDIKKDILTSNEKLESIVTEMNDAITKIDELGIRKDEALGNQSKLNEYIDLALAGNINITRDALTTLLSKFDLSSEEQRECAKLLMFPEDGLYEYDERFNKKSGKTFSDVFAEAKNSIEEPVVTPIKLETEDVKPIKLESIVPEKVAFEPIIFSPVIEKTEEPIFEPIRIEMPEVKPINLDIIEKVVKKEEINVIELLSSNEFKTTDFSTNDIKYIEDNFNSDVFNKNLKVVKDLGLNNDIFVENIELFVDGDLEEKLNVLINVGKVPFDIYLNPNILVKYDVTELKRSIDSLKESGLDPKKVPLMAF